jgi:hypothetical protein
MSIAWQRSSPASGLENNVLALKFGDRIISVHGSRSAWSRAGGSHFGYYREGRADSWRARRERQRVCNGSFARVLLLGCLCMLCCCMLGCAGMKRLVRTCRPLLVYMRWCLAPHPHLYGSLSLSLSLSLSTHVSLSLNRTATPTKPGQTDTGTGRDKQT